MLSLRLSPFSPAPDNNQLSSRDAEKMWKILSCPFSHFPSNITHLVHDQKIIKNVVWVRKRAKEVERDGE